MAPDSTPTPGIALQVPPEFVDAIAQRVVDLLGDRLPAGPASPWLDVDGAAEYLQCGGGRQRVYDLVHQGAIKPGRDGRRLLFHRDQLDGYLNGGAS